MKFGMIGLGKMGMNLVKNAVDHEIEVVAYDVNAEAVEEAGNYSEKITAVKSIDELLTELSEPKIIWIEQRSCQQLISLLMVEILITKTT